MLNIRINKQQSFEKSYKSHKTSLCLLWEFLLWLFMNFLDNFTYEIKSKNRAILKLVYKLRQIKMSGKVIFQKPKTWTYRLMECQIMTCQVVIYKIIMVLMIIKLPIQIGLVFLGISIMHSLIIKISLKIGVISFARPQVKWLNQF